MKKYLVLSVVLLMTNLSHAQLSPGKLHKSHAQLEGLENCTKCHELGKKITPKKCLTCHTVLKQRIDNGKGLHANEDHKNCVKCHVDHHGRDYELIYWEGGKDNFDHALTGYPLLGKHKGLDCEKCHQPKYITDKELLLSHNKDLKRTFLGLNQDCLSCHYDEHRGQIKEACLDCHDMSGWKPVPRFDHNKTHYPLTGKHRQVECQKCHKIVVDNKFEKDKDYLKFTGLPFRRCLNCHEDVHRNKFGNRCDRCHNTNSWKNYNRSQFDHDKTDYPLRGKHSSVACDKCHLPGKQLKIEQHEKCTDCHQDYHQGQFVHRKQKGACEECHDVNGFTPAHFTIDQHNQTDYTLKDSHLAVPCVSCHVKINQNTSLETIQFRFQSTKCLACHEDPHRGEVDKYVKQDGCEFCHSVDSWRTVTFDHDKTKFPLEGRHRTTACGDCHKPVNVGTPQEHIQFVKVTTLCQGCHEDAHAGQFRDSGIFLKVKKNFTRCERCHTSVDWLAEKFDHNRDAAFKLQGAHEKVTCKECHKKVIRNGKEITLYKPLAVSCESCHGNEKKKL